MKSNKFLMAFAAIAAVSMSSCSQDEELVAHDNRFTDNAIAFSTYIGKNPVSRGSLMTSDALKTSSAGFGVIAYSTGTYDFGATSTPNFMYNQQVKYTDDAWRYSPLKYWPNNENEKISFFAYAPYKESFEGATEGITGLSANTKGGDPTLTFTMPADVDNLIDLLYADAAATGDNKIKNLTKPAPGTNVTLNFKHALSCVSLKRKLLIDNDPSKTLDANTTITITQVTFSMNFGIKGTFNLNSGEWSDVESAKKKLNLEGDLLKNAVLKKATDDTDTTGELTLTTDAAGMMFIPVAKATGENASNGTITIDYTVETNDSKLSGGKSTVENSRSVNFNIDFEPGKAYNLVLQIGLTSVKLDATVSDWGSEDETINI